MHLKGWGNWKMYQIKYQLNTICYCTEAYVDIIWTLFCEKWNKM